MPPLSPPPYKPFSTQLGTITTYFYLLVTVKFPFSLFTREVRRVRKSEKKVEERFDEDNMFKDKMT